MHPPHSSSQISSRLAAGPAWQMNAFAIVAAFSAYFCMYAFRKPFAAGSFLGSGPWGMSLSLKSSFVISQIIGYAVAKYLGAKVLPELSRSRRASSIILLVLGSWAALLAFALAPAPAKLAALLVNGLCLGMIWGLVVSFLEGRRTSEILLAGLSCSFIVASGAVKDVGRALMRGGVSEYWMPFVTGALFLPPLLISVWMLRQLPAPTPSDESERSPRSQMNQLDKARFLRRYALPLSLILVVYFFLTAYRDYRDNYGVELFRSLGYENEPALFTVTELPVAFGVLIVLGALSLVKDNRRALALVFVTMIAGVLSLSLSTALLQHRLISGATFMTLTGLGSYLVYVPFGSVLFDRIIAHSKMLGTAVFGIYLADAVGYTGSICVQLVSEFSSASMSRLQFFLSLNHIMSMGGGILLLFSATFWLRSPERIKSSGT